MIPVLKNVIRGIDVKIKVIPVINKKNSRIYNKINKCSVNNFFCTQSVLKDHIINKNHDITEGQCLKKIIKCAGDIQNQINMSARGTFKQQIHLIACD